MAEYRRSPRQHNKSKGAIINERKRELGSIKNLMDMNSPKARSEIIKYIDKYPDDMYGHYYYGKIAQLAGDLGTAEEAYATVANSDGQIKCAGIVGLGEVARLKGETENAKRFYRQAIAESAHEEVYATHALARLERLDGNYEEAFRILNSLRVKNTANELEKVRLLGICGREQEALELAATIKPENANQERTLVYLNAMNAATIGQHETAKQYFLQVREFGIKDTEYYKALNDEARLHIDLGEFQAAVACCEESYNAGVTQFGNTNILLGVAKQGLKDYNAAMMNFKIAAQEARGNDPHNYSTSKYYLAFLELSAGDYEAAEKDLKESILPGEKPEDSTIGLLLTIYIKQKRYKDAEALIKEVQEKYSSEAAREQLELVSLIIAKQTGKSLPKRSSIPYREKQIVKHDKSEAIYHIASHHQGEPTASCFPASTDIGQLYEEVQLQMTPENKVSNDLMDKYLIDYPNAGYTPDGEIVNRICVVALPDTLDILTMYPTGEKMDLIRQRDLAKEMGKQKTKENDRISKFNARFAKFAGKQ